MRRSMLAAVLACCLPPATGWVLAPPARHGHGPTPAARMRLTLARNAGDANVEDADAAEACDANGEDTDAAEARRILGIGPSDADVEAHLSAGRNCLGTQVTLLLPAGDAPRTDAMLLAATKLTKLGASVQVDSTSWNPRAL